MKRKINRVKRKLTERIGSELTNDITTWLSSNLNRFDVLDVTADVNEGFVDFELDGEQWTIGGFSTGQNSIKFYVENISTGERWTADREVSMSRAFDGIEDAFENSPLHV